GVRAARPPRRRRTPPARGRAPRRQSAHAGADQAAVLRAGRLRPSRRQAPLPARARSVTSPPSPMSVPDPLLGFRARFPITQRSNYLISNSLGAMPSTARESVQQFLDQWDTRGVRAWAEGWWVLQEQVGSLLETLLGAAK